MSNTDLEAVAVIGSGGWGKVFISALLACGHKISAVYDDDPDNWGKMLFGFRVAGPPKPEEKPHAAAIAIGNNATRQAIAARLDWNWLTIIHPLAHVDASACIGKGSIILPGAIVGVDSVIGDHVIINTNAYVSHDCKVGAYAHMAAGSVLAGGSCIDTGVLMGIGAVSKPGISIGKWTVVGVGAAITKDLPEKVVVKGSPVKIECMKL